MATFATLTLASDRAGPCVRTLYFRGIDLTGITLAMQLRLAPDTPGAALLTLGMGANAQAEGLYLLSAAADLDGVMVSKVQLRINETTMEDAAKVPYAGELGDPSVLSYGLIGTFGGDKRTLVQGAFVALPTTYGADNAPANRPAGYQGAGARYSTWSSATLTFSDDAVVVDVDAADLLGEQVTIATQAATNAASSAADLADQLANLNLTETIGRPVNPATGAGAGALSTRVFVNPIAYSGRLKQVRLFSMLAAGQTASLVVKRMIRTPLTGSDQYDRTGTDLVLTITGPGLQTVACDWAVNAGEYLAWYCSVMAGVALIAGAGGDSGGCIERAANKGNLNSFIADGGDPTIQWQIGFDIAYPEITVARYQPVKTAVDTRSVFTTIFGTASNGTYTERKRQNATVRVSDGNTLTFGGMVIYAYNKDGALLKNYFPTGGLVGSFVFNEGDTLVWNWTTNTIGLTQVLPAPGAGLVLAAFKTGQFNDGVLLPLIVRNLSGGDARNGGCPEVRAAKFTGKNVSQGVAVVRDRLFSFKNSATDHSTYVAAWLYSADVNAGFPLLGQITHNFGHCGNASYCAASDTLSIDNNGTGVAPELAMVPNASAIAPGAQLNFADAIRIPFYTKDGNGAYTKLWLYEGGMCSSFTERPDMMIIERGYQSFYRVLLGMGANDYSDKSPGHNDLTHWGTFITGKGATEYNGTAKIIGGPFSGQFGRVNQGHVFHGGTLYYAYNSPIEDTTQWTVQANAVQMNEDGRAYVTRNFRYEEFNADGTIAAIETEGAAIIDGRYLLIGASVLGNDSGYFVLFPINDEMGGKGVVGAPIAFPFSCNQVSTVQVTPTSGPLAAPLYVSATDRSGFTVSGPAGATFNWRAAIS